MTDDSETDAGATDTVETDQSGFGDSSLTEDGENDPPLRDESEESGESEEFVSSDESVGFAERDGTAGKGPAENGDGENDPERDGRREDRSEEDGLATPNAQSSADGSSPTDSPSSVDVPSSDTRLSLGDGPQSVDTSSSVEFRSMVSRDRDGPDDATTLQQPDPSGSNEAEPAIDLSKPTYYLNRELSELAFQRRVLEEALDDDNPLLERTKFLAILTTNMDEFFRKRVGGLKQQIAAGIEEETPDGRTPVEQWEDVLETAWPIFERQSRCYREEIRPALSAAGVRIVEYDALEPTERETIRQYFESSVLPTLTPLTFDPAHPFPFISNQSLSLAILTRERPGEDPTFSRVKIPRNQVRLIPLDDGDDDRYVLLEDVVRANLDLLFPDVDVIETTLFRVTRNAEVGRNEAVAEDLIEMIEEVLEERRFATAVRLEIERDAPDEILEILTRELDLDDREVFELGGPLDYRDFAELTDLDRDDLAVPEWMPQPHPRLHECDDGGNVFDTIRDRDVLVHHPYHSFEGTVQRFLEEAANDPDVLAIKAAIYRTASDSQVIESLLEAARNGKQVAVMVELKARFDEKNNLEWAKKLEEEGIHVAYGTMGYKTHTKTSLVVREESDSVRLYSHIGTGNYHSETAKQYEDLGLFTADRDVGQDLVKLFNYFTGHSMPREYRKLLVAPGNMRDRFRSLIRAEARRARDGDDARIVAKMNRLEDPELVRELYRASMAGVDIDLIVRDICRLRPGLADVSETIDVHSIVGRFLEHSRIFYFQSAEETQYYIGSADWMARNLDTRVEAVVPIDDPGLQSTLESVLETLLTDDQNRWVMQTDGTYRRAEIASDNTGHDVHETFMRKAQGKTHREDRP